MDYKLIIPAILALASVMFLGGSITGFVVSESCCEGPTCAPDSLCTETQGPSTTSLFSLVTSAIAFMLSMIVYFLLNRKSSKT